MVNDGLEDVIAGNTAISRIGQEGLLYRGYPLEDLVQCASAEEVAFLLIEGHRPENEAITNFSAHLERERQVPLDVIDLVADVMFRGGQPMDALIAGISLLGVHDPERNRRDPAVQRARSRRLYAQVATLIGAQRPLVNDAEHLEHGEPQKVRKPSETRTPGSSGAFRERAREAVVSLGHDAGSVTGSSHAAYLLQMATGRTPDVAFTAVMNAALVIYAENEFNASTFTARTIASTLSDMHSAICGAVAALKGPLHGGANEEVTRMLRAIGDPARVSAWLDEALAAKRRIMGFGHRVYKEGDPRAPMLMRAGRRTIESEPRLQAWFDLGDRVIEEMHRRRGFRPNIDFPCGLTYAALGIPVALYPALFVAARIPGWCAHIMEQHENNRLITPRAAYVGPDPRPWSCAE